MLGVLSRKVKRNILFFFGCLLVCAILGISLAIPFFDDRKGLKSDKRVLDEDVKNLRDPSFDPEAYFYEHFVPPVGSFGMGETVFKYPNTSLLKSKIVNNCDWVLQVRNPVTGEWVNVTERLNISLVWSNVSNCYKITMNFTSLDQPVLLDYRIILLFKQSVRSFVNRTGEHEVSFEIPANSTEFFNLSFNWSDMLEYSGLIFKRGITSVDGEDFFYFMVRRNNVPPNFFISMDPTFGDTSTDGSDVDIEDQISGGYFQMGSVGGTADKISAFCAETGSGTVTTKCALYDSSKNLVANSETGTVEISGVNAWYDFTFSTSPVLVADAWYYIVLWGEERGGSTTARLDYEANAGAGGVFYDVETFNGFPASFAGDVEDDDGSASIYCTYTETPATAPVLDGEVPANESTGIGIVPDMNVTVDDENGDTLTVYWYSNSSGSTSANWYNSEWGYRKLITINSSQVGNTLVNFPILVNVSGDSDLSDNAQVDGDDIMFVLYSDNATKLCHEIENYEGGSLDAWVNVTCLYGGVDTRVWMYYGNSDCGSQADNESTWNSNYVMVQHLNETSDPHEDSTINNNDGNEGGGVNQDVDGKIDGADSFDGGDDYISCGNGNSLNLDSSMTLECYIKVTDKGQEGTDNYQYYLDRRATGWGKGYQLYTEDNNYLRFLINDGASHFITDDLDIADNDWHHIVGIRDVSDDKLILYLDGSKPINPVADSSTGSIAVDTDFEIGRTVSDASNRNANGVIDECRVSNIVRNSSWVGATFNTTNNKDSFIGFGSEEPYNLGGWFLFGKNNSVDTSGGSAILYQNNSNFSSYSTKYWWSVNVTDGAFWTNETYHFTTESGVEARFDKKVFDYYFNCGNVSNRFDKKIFDYYFECGNITNRQDVKVFDYWFLCNNVTNRVDTKVFDYYFECGNVSNRQDVKVFDYYFTCGNLTARIDTKVFDYYFECGNLTARFDKKVFDYYFTCGNITNRADTKVFDYYFQCGNVTNRYDKKVFDYYFECGNVTNRQDTKVFDYYFQCGNLTSRFDKKVFDYYFECGNTTVRADTTVFDYWYLCGNVSNRQDTKVFDYWYSCGNVTVRSDTRVFDYYFNCGNATSRSDTKVFDYYFNCGNVTARFDKKVFDYYFNCGNVTARTDTKVFDYFFECGNITNRADTKVFDYYFQCGNLTARFDKKVFDYYFQCGNSTVRTDTNVFDYYFICGNLTARYDKKVFDYWFTCGNLTSRTDTKVFDYYFICGNLTARVDTKVFDYYFNCGNITNRQDTKVFDYWFLCNNVTSRIDTKVFDYWYLCGNLTTRSDTKIFDYWYLCGNTTDRADTKVFDYYFNCGNVSNRQDTKIFDYYFECGNITNRADTKVFDYYFECGNITNRQDTKIFDYYFNCGNITARVDTKVFDYWYLCGNLTVRTDTKVFDYYFECGNVSITVEYINITNEYPVNNSNVYSLYPSVHFTLNHTNGVSMNYSLYWNTSSNINRLFGKTNNVANGTYYHSFNNGTSYTFYYWSVNVTDGTNWVNESYVFTIAHSGGASSGGGRYGTGMLMGMSMSFMLLGMFMGVMIFKKRKNNNNDGGIG